MMNVVLAKTVTTIGSALAEKFTGSVIQRWTRHRAECFLESFANAVEVELSSGKNLHEVDVLLDAMLADEVKSAVLFDAYRRVCFTQSKTLGPRILGLLTGRLILQGRMASEEEERIFESAESLSDGEFMKFLQVYQEYFAKAEVVTDQTKPIHIHDGAVIVRWSQTDMDSHSRIEFSSFKWREVLGSWAVKLNRCGLLTERSQQESDIYAGSHGIRFVTDVIFEKPCDDLCRLLIRSRGSE